MIRSIALIVLLGVAQLTHAASQRELSIDDLVALSDEIVVGRVVASEVRWQGELIVTVATIEVVDAWVGSARRLEVTELGGTALHPRTGIRMRMEASTRSALRDGEEWLLFLARGRAGLRAIVGGRQGAFEVNERAIAVGPKRFDGDRTLRARAITLDEMRREVGDAIERRAVGRR